MPDAPPHTRSVRRIYGGRIHSSVSCLQVAPKTPLELQEMHAAAKPTCYGTYGARICDWVIHFTLCGTEGGEVNRGLHE